MSDLAFEIVEDESELEDETPTYEVVSREGMVYCEFCKGYYLPEFHYGDQDNDDNTS